MPHRADPLKLSIVAAVERGLRDLADLPDGCDAEVIDLAQHGCELEVRVAVSEPGAKRRRHFVARVTEHWT